MNKYRKMPVVVEAMLFIDNASAVEILKWGGTPPIRTDINPASGIAQAILIDTLEGTMRADVGDWIIRGVKGEFYPCKPDIFKATYKAVGDDES